MKIKNIFILSACIALIFSCSTSSDECHECHIAFDGPNGEIEVPIMAPDGGDEFCGPDLEAAEAPDYSYTLDADVIIGNDTIPAGTYNEIHCEEHGDDHDH